MVSSQVKHENIIIIVIIIMGHAVVWWLTNYSTNRKVTVRDPMRHLNFINLPNPSGHTWPWRLLSL
jgi:hypothetical protein